MAELTFPVLKGVPPARQLRIFSLETPRISERTVRDAGKRLGLSAGIRSGLVQFDNAKITYVEGHHVITCYHASGGLRYHDRSRWQVDDGRSNVELSDRVATDIAKKYLTRLELAPAKECRVLKVTRLQVATADRERREQDHRVIDVGVLFQRLIEGVPVDGPGGKIVVYLDRAGQMTGFDRIWRDIRGAYRRVKDLRPPQVAADELARLLANRAGGRVEVRDVRFGYFEFGWRHRQRYLQPAYIALLTLYSRDERFHRRSVHVSAAATNAVGRLTPQPQKAAPQEQRRP